MAIFLAVTLPVMILEVSLFWCAVLDIYCKDSSYMLCKGASAGMTCVEALCMCFSVVVSVFIVAISLLIVYWTGLPLWELIIPFAYSRLQSWVLWFPLMFFMPCCGFLWKWTT